MLINSFLKGILDGDTGSTMLGTIASALLAGDVKWHSLAHWRTPQGMEEYGKILTIVVLAVWGWKTGKRTAPKRHDEQPPYAALAQ